MEEIIKEIAELIDSGEVVFLHRETQEILSYPAPDRSGYNEYDYLAEEVLAITDMNPELYIQFDPPDSRESYKIMEGFVETVEIGKIKAIINSQFLPIICADPGVGIIIPESSKNLSVGAGFKKIIRSE